MGQLDSHDFAMFNQSHEKSMTDIYPNIAKGVVGLTKACRADLMEVCCPANSTLGAAVEARGGAAVRRVLSNGFDVGAATGVRRATRLLRRVLPRGLVLSPPRAADRARLNLNRKSEEQKRLYSNEVRQARRIQKGCRPLREHAKNIIDSRAGLEQPWNSQSWSRSLAIKQMRCEMHETAMHGGAYGWRGARSDPPTKKAWKICSADPEFA